MEGFTLIDGVVAAVIVVSALLAYSAASCARALAIAGWIVAAFVAFMFAPQVQPLVKEIPVVGAMIADSCELSIIAAFGAVFALALVVASLFTPLFSNLVQRSILGGLDQGRVSCSGCCAASCWWRWPFSPMKPWSAHSRSP
jgi:membrane protein required for colicin V production